MLGTEVREHAKNRKKSAAGQVMGSPKKEQVWWWKRVKDKEEENIVLQSTRCELRITEHCPAPFQKIPTCLSRKINGRMEHNLLPGTGQECQIMSCLQNVLDDVNRT